MINRARFFFFLGIAFIATSSYSDPIQPQAIPIVFYVPSVEESDAFFNAYLFLYDIEFNNADFDPSYLTRYYSIFLRQSHLRAFVFKMYLLRAENPRVREWLIQLLADDSFRDDYSISLRRLYNSKAVTEKVYDNKLARRYISQDGYYDENINYFILARISLFNGLIELYTFNNDWEYIHFTKDGIKQENVFQSTISGGTNGLNLSAKRIACSGVDAFQESIKQSLIKKKYLSVFERDITNEGIMKGSNADKALICIAGGESEVIKSIYEGYISLFLLSLSNEEMYEISYYYNISTANMHYHIKEDILSYLSLLLTMSKIK